MNKILAEEGDICKYIPHRPPFVFVHKLLFCDKEKSVTSFRIHAHCYFLENGYLGEAALIENIAQTAAVGFGYYYIMHGLPIKVGYIAAIKNLNIFELAGVDQEIFTEVKIENEILGLNIISGRIICGNNIVASGEMKIFINN